MHGSGRRSKTGRGISAAEFLLEFPQPTKRTGVIRAIHGVVCALVRSVDLREDIFQECVIHLWRAISKNPHKPAAWHLRSCAWYIKDLLRHGRSLDSPKNISLRCQVDQITASERLLINLVAPDNVLENVSVNELITELTQRVIPPDNEVLVLLASGYQLGEIAHKLHLPQREVSRSRARIAEVAISLGLRP